MGRSSNVGEKTIHKNYLTQYNDNIKQICELILEQKEILLDMHREVHESTSEAFEKLASQTHEIFSDSIKRTLDELDKSLNIRALETDILAEIIDNYFKVLFDEESMDKVIRFGVIPSHDAIELFNLLNKKAAIRQSIN